MLKQVEDEAVNVESSETKQYFINDDKFQLLRKYQQLIFEATEVSPAIRKLVNELISAENLEKVREKFVNQWKQ
jgi:site-specific DNA-adenine methylase